MWCRIDSAPALFLLMPHVRLTIESLPRPHSGVLGSLHGEGKGFHGVSSSLEATSPAIPELP